MKQRPQPVFRVTCAVALSLALGQTLLPVQFLHAQVLAPAIKIPGDKSMSTGNFTVPAGDPTSAGGRPIANSNNSNQPEHADVVPIDLAPVRLPDRNQDTNSDPQTQINASEAPIEKMILKPGKSLSIGMTTEDIVCTNDVALAAKQAASYPDSPEASFIYAVALSRTSHVEDALKEVRRARRLAEKQGGPGYFDKMIQTYENMLTYCPDDNQVRYHLAWAYYMKAYVLAKYSHLANTPQAKYKEWVAQAIKPDEPPKANGVAAGAAEPGKDSTATTAVTTSNNSTSQSGSGTAQSDSGTAQSASGTAQSASGTAQSGSGTAQSGSGTAQSGSGTAQSGSGAAESGKEANATSTPTSAKSPNSTATAEQPENTDVLKNIQKASSTISSASPQAIPQVQKYYRLATGKLDDLLARDPSDVWARVYRAFLMAEASGDLPTAMAEWQKVKDQNPANPAAYFFLGQGYLKQGNLKECLSNVSKAVALRAIGN